MKLPVLEIILDGVSITVETGPGDYIRAERDGHTFPTEEGERVSAPAMASVSFHALTRAKRKGLVDVEVPPTFEDFLDSFDLPDPTEQEDDDQGNE